MKSSILKSPLVMIIVGIVLLSIESRSFGQITKADANTLFNNMMVNINTLPLAWQPATLVHSIGDLPQISIDPTNQVFVSWRDNRRGDFNFDTYVRRSNNGGQTFGADILAANDTPWPHTLLAGANGNVHIVWSNHAVSMTQSTNSGDTFGNEVRIDDGTVDSYNSESRPDLARDGSGNLYVVFSTGSYPQGVYFAKSSNGGSSFGPIVRVADVAVYQGYPSVAVSPNGMVYVIWSTGGDVYLSRSANGGINFESAQRVNDVPGKAGLVTDLAIYGNDHVYIVFADDRSGILGIYLSRSADGGITFDADQKLNDDGGIGIRSDPSISVGPTGTILVSWFDTRNIPQGGLYADGDIYTAYSTDNGISFSNNSRVNTEVGSVPGLGWGRSLTAFDTQGRAHMVWQGIWSIFHSIAILPFLDLPISYTNFAQAAQGNVNGNGPGRVNSWFDHDAPTYHSNDILKLWNGTVLTQTDHGASNCQASSGGFIRDCTNIHRANCWIKPGGLGVSCYDGHNGIDFQQIPPNEQVFAAASGTVISTTTNPLVTNCTEGTKPKDGECSLKGYGNQVWIDHINGYATRYGHLRTVSVTVGTIVAAGQV